MSKKKITAFASAILALLCLSACTAVNVPTDGITDNTVTKSDSVTPAESTPAAEGTGSEGTTDTPDTQTTSPESPENQEPKDEQPSGDKILLTPESDFEIYYTFDSSQYAIFYTGSEFAPKYGVIDMEGNIRIEPVHDLLGWCLWHEVLYNDALTDGDSPIYIDEKYKLDVHYGHGGSEGYYEKYICDSSNGKIYLLSWDMDMVTVNQVQSVAPYIPFVSYSASTAIIPGTYFFETDGGKIDGMCYYDYLWNQYCIPNEYFIFDTNGNKISLGICDEEPDGFINDRILIKRDGKFGFINRNGEPASQLIYENAADAWNGKAWVKLNGKWQVIALS